MDRYIRDNILTFYPLSDRQYAYQPGKFTDSALDDLNRLLSESLEDKEVAVGTFMDIEGTFNNVPTTSLMSALMRKNIPQTICWIESSLRSRVIISTLGEDTIEARVGRGCPQGGVLSPLYWAVLVDELLVKMAKERFYCLGYSDDIAVVVRGKHLDYVSKRTHNALNIVDEWCREEGLSINPRKTVIGRGH